MQSVGELDCHGHLQVCGFVGVNMCARVKCCGIVDGCVHKHVCMQKCVHVRCTTLPASSFHVLATKYVSSASSKSSQHLPVSTSPWIVVPHTVCNSITLQCPLEKVSQIQAVIHMDC